MRILLEGSIFLGFALAVHLAVWPAAPETGAEGGGQGGDALLSVQASSASIMGLVAKWESPPEVTMVPEDAFSEPRDVAMMAPDLPATLKTQTAPTSIQPPKPPVMQPDVPALPGYQPQPPAPPQTPGPDANAHTTPLTANIRPMARPKGPSEQQRNPKLESARKTDNNPKEVPDKMAQNASSDSAASTARKAQGTGETSARGRGGQAQVATLSRSQRQSLIVQWGGQIRARIARRAPQGAGRGTAVVTITVSGDGVLLGVSLAQSSGNPRIDKLAIAAVRNTRQFPAAPARLGIKSHRFKLPVKSR